MNRASRLAQHLLMVAVFALPACSIVSKGVGDYDIGYKERGYASWYGPGFHGRPTASGEIYDQGKLTAAHRALPLGSVVRVINAHNGRHVEVRINDRGPFLKGRIIDLSYAAAKRLDMIQAGTMPVVLEVIRRGEGGSPGDSLDLEKRQEGSLGLDAMAEALTVEGDSRYGNAWIVPGRPDGDRPDRRPIEAIRDERWSRRLSELVADAPHPALSPA